MIELQRVCRDYKGASGTTAVLREISLQFMSGEHVAIVGRSGSGKSTLLNMLTGIDHPSRGEVHIGGVNIHRLDESALARWRGRHVGIVFQFFQLMPALTIEQNLLLAMDLVQSIPRPDRRSRAGALLEQMGIAAHARKLPAALSGGEQQRAAIARALANNPPIIVADEPTGNLDSQMGWEIHALLAQLARQGKTVIVVTHDRQAATDFERVITLEDGRVAREDLRSGR
ncbi:MAG: ABC transporter ATP-binding protein [Xanthomonadales bacterium]|nr:ABC transporter ATP-binding protein [Xanthomonadales bacterium]